ncbi:hypothetical protein K7X08_028652 [Anisodus acutangulus]|uniref:Uncharacterized protein n=1 Tax=Anisodus acutangulus TaxID=402998 RepID=A0A9Q1LTL8_9SOLA|nr:hypothetical protein K7X08_028652 [Anisodus acutangulus]
MQKDKEENDTNVENEQKEKAKFQDLNNVNSFEALTDVDEEQSVELVEVEKSQSVVECSSTNKPTNKENSEEGRGCAKTERTQGERTRNKWQAISRDNKEYNKQILPKVVEEEVNKPGDGEKKNEKAKGMQDMDLNKKLDKPPDDKSLNITIGDVDEVEFKVDDT